MAYKEVSRMDTAEVIRRWQKGISLRPRSCFLTGQDPLSNSASRALRSRASTARLISTPPS